MAKIIFGILFIFLILFILTAMIIFVLPYIPSVLRVCREAIQEIKDELNNF